MKSEVTSLNPVDKQDSYPLNLKILHSLFGYEDAGTFATEILGYSGPMWSNIVKIKAKWPSNNKRSFVLRCREKFPSINFSETHLDLDHEEFKALFVGIGNSTAVDQPEPRPLTPPTFHPQKLHHLQKLSGYFLGIYCCRSRTDLSKEAITYDGFHIICSDDNDTEARIIQITDPHVTTSTVEGILRVRHDTIEIRIDFKTEDDPDAVYLAAVPKGDVIDAFLAVVSDIKYGTRLVASKPTIFIRVTQDDMPGFTRVIDEGSPVYGQVKKLFDAFVEFDSNKYEIQLKSQIDEQGELTLKNALAALRKEASEPPPSEGVPSNGTISESGTP